MKFLNSIYIKGIFDEEGRRIVYYNKEEAKKIAKKELEPLRKIIESLNPNNLIPFLIRSV
jgi:hypothetical protein